MEGSLFVQGMIIGLTLAVPVGPISLLCIQRAVSWGRLHGIASGIGVASADSFYAAVSFLGLTIISGLILSEQYLFRLVAGTVLVCVGIRVFFAVPSVAAGTGGRGSYLKDFLSTAAIGIANPLTLLFYIIIMPGFGFATGGTLFMPALEFVAGVFSGSTAWWILLCGSIGTVRKRISGENLGLVNRISGTLITFFGVCMLLLLLLNGQAG